MASQTPQIAPPPEITSQHFSATPGVFKNRQIQIVHIGLGSFMLVAAGFGPVAEPLRNYPETHQLDQSLTERSVLWDGQF
jgi:hypothetical protein